MNGSPAPRQWHIDPETMCQWVEGSVGPMIGASIEAHLVRCVECRAAATALVPPAELAQVWDEVLTEIELPRPSWAERLLVRLSISHSDALVVASAVALRAAWLLATVGILFFTVVAGLLAGDGGVPLFLLVAPLIPVAGVATAYGPTSDPSYEAVLASPYALVRLILLRTASVLGTSVPFVVIAGLLLPMPTTVAVAWLLPAAGFIAVVLTMSNWVDPTHAAAVLAVGWVFAVVAAGATGDLLVVLAPAALFAYSAIGAVAVLSFAIRVIRSSPSWRLR